MDQLRELKQYLDASIKRNGNQPLTVQHLSNIIGVLLQKHDKGQETLQKAWDETEDDIRRYGSD